MFGLGRSKTSLVKKAVERASLEKSDPNREVWIVFDMDFNHLVEPSLQRNDFNEAVRLAHANKFKVAYSNDSFELWFLLHYELLESALTRTQYYLSFSKRWGVSYENLGKNERFSQNVYQRLLEDQNANQNTAIRNAKRLHQLHSDKDIPPADQNPCTTVTYWLLN